MFKAIYNRIKTFFHKEEKPKFDALGYANIRRFDAQQKRNLDPKFESDVRYWTGFCDGVKMQRRVDEL